MAVQSTLRRPEDPLVILFRHYSQLLLSRVRNSSRTVKLAATVALLLSIIGTGYGGYSWWKDWSKERIQGRQLLRKNSGLRGKDGSRIIYVPYKSSLTSSRTSKVTIHPTKSTTFDAHRRLWRGTTAIHQAWFEFSLFAPTAQLIEHHDSPMEQQGNRPTSEPWCLSHAKNIPISGGG